MLKHYDPHLHLREIVLVGVGGTGAALARLIARLLVHMQALGMSIPTLTLIDPDVVELKNIARQHYSQAEIGYFKSEIIAKRLSCALGLPVHYITESFDARQHIGRQSYGILLIDAVDNHLARCEIYQCQNIPLISCGNGLNFSQVCLGDSQRDTMLSYLQQVEQRQQTLGEKDSLRYLPHPYVVFPQLLEPDVVEPDEDVSCAIAVLREEQGLYVNDITALIAARYVQQLLLRQPIESFITFCNMDGALSTNPIVTTLDNLHTYLKD